MQRLHTICRGIDRLTTVVGRTVSWFAVLLILVGALNTILRYVGGYLQVSLTSNALGEIQWMLYSAMFLLAAGWTLREDAHVRVDVLYERFSPKSQALVDLLGTLLLLLPFCAFGLWVSWDYVMASVTGLETTADSGKLPVWPAKLLILFGFGFLGLQGISLALRSLAQLTDNPIDEGGQE